MEQLQSYYQQIIQFAWQVLPSLIWAIVAWFGGLWIIKWVTHLMNAALEKGLVEISLRKFLSSLFSIGLKLLLLISVASMVGIATTSFVAIIGAAGLAVGLALQGSLANFAGGILILLLKPFTVGDVIEAQGVVGKVDAIQIFYTILKTADNKTIIIPNGNLSNNMITNFTSEQKRRVDMTFGIGYNDDIAKAKTLLSELLKQDNRILSQPEPQIVVSELADSSVNLSVRAWVNTSDYWAVYFDMQEKVKLRFDQEGINIPYPQHDVHLYQQTT